ncbi:MAG TPA: M48 family metallopeptidase [Tissierellaceae bacterium]|nr:M48 family metallopeptidase [Tissierellaceae bacterium]
MDSKLKLSIFVFLLVLTLFITTMIISEYRNMNKLKFEYPDLSDDVYAYRKDSLRVWAIDLLLQFVVPFLFLITGLSQRISIWASDNKGIFRSGLLYGLIFFTITFIINLPLRYYGSFHLAHKYGLTNQSIFRWLELNLKGFLVNDLILIFVLWIPYYIILNNPKTWWLKLGILMVPIIIFVTFISPTIIDPIFNEYSYIEDKELENEISKLLEKANIEDADIFEVDKSRDTKMMNAYMTGIGKSKRIVLWDTTINNLEQEEVLAITAHEIGHYIEGHIWKSILLSSLGTLFIMYLLYLTSNRILEGSNGIFGFHNLGNYASIPLLILVLNIYTFLGNPIMNYISRTMEVEADGHEIILTEDREAATSAMEKLQKESLGLPRPSKFYKIWYLTHPSLEERIEFYETYDISDH